MISEVRLCDCMDFMRGMGDKAIDLAICDIPYGIDVGRMAYLKEIKTTVRQKNGTLLNGNKNKKAYTPKDWDKHSPPQAYFDELKRVSKNQIIFGIEYTNWIGVGVGRIKWDKGIAEGMSFKRYETAYCSFIDTIFYLPLLWAGMLQAYSLKEPMRQQGNKKLNEKRIHPCHKPVLLYDAILKNFAKKGDKILDTHLGSGSSRISAYKNGFDFYGCEIDEEYFIKQEKRFKEYTNQQVIQF